MDTASFWSLIGQTISADADRDAQLHALYDALDELDCGRIEGFERAFQNELKRCYTWDLWGAAFVIHGGASNDAFDYFQRWLIAQGRAAFEAVLGSPDSLADIIPDTMAEPCDFEEFGYVAIDVWTKKTGIDALSDPASSFPHLSNPPQLSGTPFKDTEAHLSRRYPRLWGRFGNMPLG